MRPTSVNLCRKSATLIILARNNNKSSRSQNNEFNYKILSFKRTEKTSFMPNHIVFPGGVCETSDQSKEWITHFKKYGINDGRIVELTKVNQINRPTIFQSSDSDEIKREISLRITAIRETFEELGILICRQKHELQNNGHSDKNESIFGKFSKDNEQLKLWQNIVHNDSTKFLELCEKLEVVPDLWSLYEWSAWMTPAVFKKRFETAFFLVALNKMPDVIPEPHEVDEYMWQTPAEYLSLLNDEKIFLPPPQVYEFLRMSKYYDILEMAEFAKKRSNKGTTLFLPTQYRCSDGIVGVLPGDDAYPNNPNDITEPIDNSQESLEQFRKRMKKLHRSEHKSLHNVKYYLNFQPFNEHLSPIAVQSNSKL